MPSEGAERAGERISAGVLRLLDEDWDERVLGASVPVLVDFWARWCVPCRAVEELVEEMARRYAGRLAVGTLDVDENPRSASRYDVLSLPTLIVFRDGQPQGRLSGRVTRARLERTVTPSLA